MEDKVLELVEAVYDRTTSYEGLLREVGTIFPTYVTDLSIRQELHRLPGLPPKPSLEELELLLVWLNTLVGRLSEGAISNQERMIILAEKLGIGVWSGIREHPTWRRLIVSYERLVEAARGYLAEMHVNRALDQLPVGGMRRAEPVLAIGDGKNPTWRPRPARTKVDK
jgi:hypothetical protein